MGFIGEGFYKWGLFAAKRPFTVILMGIVIVCIGFTGFLNS